MRTLTTLLNEYGESHQNTTNKKLHWICVPIIFFTIFGLLRCIPFPQTHFLSQTNLSWSALALIVVWIYYFNLSKMLSLGFIIWISLIYAGNEILFDYLGKTNFLLFTLLLFGIAWIGQFIGHKIEGKKPSFLKDLQFLLIGPAWLMKFIFDYLKIDV